MDDPAITVMLGDTPVRCVHTEGLWAISALDLATAIGVDPSNLFDNYRLFAAALRTVAKYLNTNFFVTLDEIGLRVTPNMLPPWAATLERHNVTVH
jgi:hypothetical protein